MTTCADWREELEDCALGLPSGAALEAHLASCAACAAALAELRARVEQLASGIARLISVEPSPYLGPRLLAEISAMPARSVGFERWKPALAAAALAACLTVVGYVIHVTPVRRERAEIVPSPVAAAALSRWTSPTEALLSSPADTLLKTIPRLGETFFEMNPQGRMTRQKKGGENAK